MFELFDARRWPNMIFHLANDKPFGHTGISRFSKQEIERRHSLVRARLREMDQLAARLDASQGGPLRAVAGATEPRRGSAVSGITNGFALSPKDEELGQKNLKTVEYCKTLRGPERGDKRAPLFAENAGFERTFTANCVPFGKTAMEWNTVGDFEMFPDLGFHNAQIYQTQMEDGKIKRLREIQNPCCIMRAWGIPIPEVPL